MEQIAGIIGQQELRQEKALYRQSREQLQRLYARGAAAVAEALDRHCLHCGVLLVPVIHEVRHPKGIGGIMRCPVFSLCGCADAQGAALAEEQTRAEQEASARRDQRAAQLVGALAQSGLTGWLASATFDTFQKRGDWGGAVYCAVKVRHFVDAVLNGTTGDRPWLILHGRYGTGKTHLSAAAIREAIEYGWRDVYFRPWVQYLKRLQASWDRVDGEERTSDIVTELQRGKLVAIDDLDKKEPRKGWAKEELFAVLNYRYNARLPTILTFNCAPSESDPVVPGRLLLERYMSRAILDRVTGARFDAIDFDGPSYRSGVTWQR